MNNYCLRPSPLLDGIWELSNPAIPPYTLLWDLVDPASICDGRLHAPGGTVFSPERIEAMLSRIANVPASNMRAIFMGEPLLHPSLGHILTSMRAFWPGATIILETGGALAIERYLAFLKSARAGRIILSLRALPQGPADLALLAATVVDNEHVLAMSASTATPAQRRFLTGVADKWPNSIAQDCLFCPSDSCFMPPAGDIPCPFGSRGARIDWTGNYYSALCSLGLRLGALWQAPIDALTFPDITTVCGGARECPWLQTALHWPATGFESCPVTDTNSARADDVFNQELKTGKLAIIIDARRNTTGLGECLASIALQGIADLVIIILVSAPCETDAELEAWRHLWGANLHVLPVGQESEIKTLELAAQLKPATQALLMRAWEILPPSFFKDLRTHICADRVAITCADSDRPDKTSIFSANAKTTETSIGEKVHGKILTEISCREASHSCSYTVAIKLDLEPAQWNQPREIPMLADAEIMLFATQQPPEWILDLLDYRPDIRFRTLVENESWTEIAAIAACEAAGEHILFISIASFASKDIMCAFKHSPALLVSEIATRHATCTGKIAWANDLSDKYCIPGSFNGACLPRRILKKIFASRILPPASDEATIFLLCIAQTRSLALIAKGEINNNTKLHEPVRLGHDLNSATLLTGMHTNAPFWERSFRDFAAHCAQPLVLSHFEASEDVAEPLISIIVPTYNQKANIRKCLNSILLQEYSSWEAIIVDDASDDGTLEICAEYAAAVPAIRIFANETNHGQGYSRNFALTRTRGKYIVYLDSDDMLMDGFLLKAAAMMECGDGLDYIQFGFIRQYLGGECSFKTAALHGLLDANGCSSAFSLYCKGILNANAAWAKIIRKDFLISHHIIFGDGIGEDNIFLLMLYMFATKALFVDWPAYVLRDCQHEASTRMAPRITWRHISGLCGTIHAMEAFFNQHAGYDGAMEDKFATFMSWDVDKRVWYFVEAERLGIPWLPDQYASMLANCPNFMALLYKKYVRLRIGAPACVKSPLAPATRHGNLREPKLYKKHGMDSDWQPDVAYICVASQLEALLAESADGIKAACQLNHEIILMSGESSTALIACKRLAAVYPQISIYRIEARQSEAEIRNFGASKARGKRIFFPCLENPLTETFPHIAQSAINAFPLAKVLVFSREKPLTTWAETESRLIDLSSPCAILAYMAGKIDGAAWNTLLICKDFLEKQNLRLCTSDYSQAEYILRALKHAGSVHVVRGGLSLRDFRWLPAPEAGYKHNDEIVSCCAHILEHLRITKTTHVVELEDAYIHMAVERFFFGPHMNVAARIANKLAYEEILSGSWVQFIHNLISFPQMLRLLLLDYGRLRCAPAKGEGR